MRQRAHTAWLPHLTRHRIGLLVAFLAALLAFLLLLAWMSARMAAAAPLLDGVDERSWARDAVAGLTAAGLVQGYPDGTYKGDRSMTRDEAARLLELVQQRLEEQGAGTATREDLDSLTRQVEALHDALEAEGVRGDDAGRRVDNLEKRLENLDRPGL